MKKIAKKNKKFIIIGIIIIILLIIGIAFAYFTTTLNGSKDYVIRAGSLKLDLTEENELTLERVIPVEDSEGMSLDGFSFSLTNEGDIDTDYTIYLDDVALNEGESRISDTALRYSLVKNNVVGQASDLVSMGSNPNRVVDSGTISPDEKINYTLKIWVDYDATSEVAGGRTFKGALRIEDKQAV